MLVNIDGMRLPMAIKSFATVMIRLIFSFLFMFSTQLLADEQSKSAIDRRIASEIASLDNSFSITPHRPTYVLPFAYNRRPNKQAFVGTPGEFDRAEIKFQLSLKSLVWKGVFGDRGQLSLAYTQQSYWQAYNRDNSSPFRETNHEPEVILTFFTDVSILGLRNRILTFGLNHQSNGQAEPLSRSWNRVYAQFIFERGDYYLSFKPWVRFNEDVEDDDNPNIEDYMGHFEIHALYYKNKYELGLTLRNNLHAENRGAVQLDWSYPISEQFNGYIQLFSGYGESLIDYDAYINRIGFGFALVNWL